MSVPHLSRAGVLVVFLLATAGGRAEQGPAMLTTTFETVQPGEAVARIAVRCDECAWDVPGREAAVFSITLDSRYLQHLPAIRGGRAEYRVMLGAVTPGPHTLRVERDDRLSARLAAGARVEHAIVEQTDESSPAYLALALAPFVYARPDTVPGFTDVPVFMWYETEPTPRGVRYRYSVIFTHEDGGTPADRLMATWGRTTDIEYLYRVEVDRRGAILEDDIQGPEHEILPFLGRREGRHPLLWVVTDNNMVLDNGTSTVRYAPAPIAFPLRDVSREAVMDAHPWLYVTMAKELIREGRIVADAGPGKGTIPDPRRFVFIEACGELRGAALALAVGVDSSAARQPESGTVAAREWVASDRGVREYRVVRDGCFRVAIPLPPPLGTGAVTAIRAQAYTRPPGREPGGQRPGGVRLTRINTVFMLDEQFQPMPSVFRWTGVRTVTPDGPPVEWRVP